MKLLPLRISDVVTGIIGGTAAVIFCSYAACAQVPSVPNPGDGGAATPVVTTPNSPCSLLDGVDSSGTLRTICVDAGEVAAIVQFILTLRSILTDSGTNPRIGSQSDCTPLMNICATSAERSAGIVYISGLRDARLKRDGGK